MRFKKVTWFLTIRYTVVLLIIRFFKEQPFEDFPMVSTNVSICAVFLQDWIVRKGRKNTLKMYYHFRRIVTQEENEVSSHFLNPIGKFFICNDKADLFHC